MLTVVHWQESGILRRELFEVALASDADDGDRGMERGCSVGVVGGEVLMFKELRR